MKVISPETLEELLKRFDGEPLILSGLGRYSREALTVFTDPNSTAKPSLSITLTTDITAAEQTYNCLAKSLPVGSKGTLTAFLSWALLRTLDLHSSWRWRYLNGSWWQLNNPPCYIPIATGRQDDHLSGFLLENIAGCSFSHFAVQYCLGVAKARTEGINFGDTLVYNLSVLMGNLPTLRFTALELHSSNLLTGQPMFYFGQRHRVEERLLMPFHCTFHHANADPVRLEALLNSWQGILAAPE